MMTPTTEPVGAENQRAWDLVMALHVLGPVKWDLFLDLCDRAGYANVPMGFFEESWEGRPREDGRAAHALMRGGKTDDSVELNDFAHKWIPCQLQQQPLADRLRRAKRLPPLLKTAQDWLDKQGGN